MILNSTIFIDCYFGLQELQHLFEEFGVLPDTENVHVGTESVGDEEDELEWGDDLNEETGENVHRRIEEYVDVNQEETGTASEEDSHSDNNENDAVACKCKCKQNCLEQFNIEDIQAHIYSLREMEKDPREMYIMGCLQKIGSDDT